MFQPAILTGSIGGGASRFLHGRSNFYFEPNVGQGEGVQGGNEGNQGQQQQNQNQQQELESPFKGIDLNLLDDQTRQSIQRAEAQLKDFHGRANQASIYQSEKDKVTAQLQLAQQSLQQLQNQSQQQQARQQQQAEPTFEEELTQTYIEGGLQPDQAKAAAAMQAKILGRFGNRFQQQQDQRFAPIIGNVVDSNTQRAFQEAIATDSHGLFQNQELAQKVWEQAEQLKQQGQLVSPQVLHNLARIYSFDMQSSGGLPQGNAQPFQQQQFLQPPMQQNQQTRFTFPGALSHVKQPNQQQQDNVDPETQAAMAATVSGWAVKPAAFKNVQSNSQVRITRGGI